MAKKKWFLSGKEGIARSKEEDKLAKTRRSSTDPWRFRLKNDESAKVTFLDDPLFFFYEHSEMFGRTFINETCIREVESCPACDGGYNPSYCVAATIIDHRVWEDKDGKKHRNQKKLFVARGRARQAIVRKYGNNQQNLKFAVFEMARGSGANECNTGEDFDFLKRLSATQVKKFVPEEEKPTWLEPFKYDEIFAAKTGKELRKVFGGEAPVGSDEDETGDEGETKTEELDLEELEEQLEGMDRDELEEFIGDNELEVKVVKSTKESLIRKRILNAMSERVEEGGGEDEGGEDEEKTDSDEMSIDDLI